MSVRVKNNIHWVGKIDWELRKFHGDEYSTHRGSTYNSYLITDLLGSPTINRGILVSVAGLLEEMKGLQFKNKKAAAFGCYGWSGESSKIISDNLKTAGFELVDDGIKAMWNPDIENSNKYIEYGSLFAGKVRS